MIVSYPKFKIYYADGTTYAGDPYKAPARGVLVIISEDKEHGRILVHNGDYYCWDDRGGGLRWWEADHIGMIDYLIEPGAKRVLIGRLVDNPLWEEIWNKAYYDPDFPPKTASRLRHHGRTA